MADDKKESPEEARDRRKREEFTKKNQKALTEQNKINKEGNRKPTNKRHKDQK